MTRSLCVQLAHSRSDYEAAFRLLQSERKRWELCPSDAGELWITKQHALPSTNVVIAKEGEIVVGALTLFGESAFRLPLEEKADLTQFRQDLGGRVAELSLPGLAEDHQQDCDLVYALYHFALCFGSTHCHYEAFVTQVPSGWARDFVTPLHLEPLLLGQRLHSGEAYFRSAREGADCRQHFGPGTSAAFRFPEKKFFLVAHQSLEPELLHYFFNERTQLFQSLSDLELRVLKNVYDFGEFARALPNRAGLRMPDKSAPKHRRFPMNCEGYLVDEKGKRTYFQVLDVSREGLKIRAEEPLRRGSTYALTIAVGVKKDSEVIATTVWFDEDAQIAGLQLQSGDRNWNSLVEYLESDYLRIAA